MSDKPTEPVEDDDDETELETRVVPRRRFVMRGGQLVEITAGPNVETR